MEDLTLHSTQRDPRTVAMATSLLVSFLMLAGKSTAFAITGSSAIFSDAAESVIHVLATAFVGFSLWYAVQPPDTEHPYGHGKIAYLSSGFEGGLIFLAALIILYTSLKAFIVGPELRQLSGGLLLIAAMGVINLGLGVYLIRVGKRHNSLVLLSNGQHVLSDMWTSLGVVVGVALVWLTDLTWLDPLVAFLVGLNLAWMAFRLMWRSLDGLMEKVDDADTRAILATLDRAVEQGDIAGYHQVRHRQVNDQVWVEYHLLFAGSVSLGEAHAKSHTVEASVADLFSTYHVVVTAHLEPAAHQDAHPLGHSEPADPLGETGFG